MLTLSQPCPRCLHEKSVLSVVWADAHINDPTIALREVLVRCAHCLKHSIAIVHTAKNTQLYSNPGLVGDIKQYERAIQFKELIPKPPVNVAPDNVPSSVASAFTDGQSILAKKMWTPAAGSFRTSLDRATKLLWADSGITETMPFKLEARLKKLQSKLSIPEAMLNWADGIRVVGNEMHELDDVEQADAEDAAHFTEMFLTYAFTLPARVEKFNKRRLDNAKTVSG